MKLFQAADGKDSCAPLRFLVSRTSTVAVLCPTSTHSEPLDFELTRQVSSVVKPDIVLSELSQSYSRTLRTAGGAGSAERWTALGLMGMQPSRGSP